MNSPISRQELANGYVTTKDIMGIASTLLAWFLPHNAINMQALPPYGVCLSVTFVYSVETNKHIFKTFAPLGSHIILVLRISPLTASNKCHNLSLSGGAVLITPRRSQRWQHATKPDTGRKSRFLPIPPAFSASVRWSPSEYCHDFWYEKLEWWKKILKLFISTEYTNVTDRRTDRQRDGRTPHDGIGRTCIT